MKNISLALLAAATMGAVSISGASAMPFGSSPLGESLVQDVRVVCDRFGRCYDTRPSNRVRTYHAPRYYDRPAYYGSHRGYDRGYYSGPRVGVGIGTFGVGAW